jgi:hypothetical protein|tara:strand:- start:4033 stop:4950 length:918 start_codon:yes stop_codon:yes gene_type:complete
MITFEEYKQQAQKIYSENKEGKSCPDDDKLSSWFECYKKDLGEGIGISKTVKNGVNAKVQNSKKNSVDFVREDENLDETTSLSLANQKGSNLKPKPIKDKKKKKKIKESDLREYVTAKLAKLDRLSEIASQKENLSENYPIGAENDSSAPWNQEDQKTIGGKESKLQISIDGGDPDNEFIFNLQNKWFVVNKETLRMNSDEYRDITFDYGEVPYDITGQDEDGDAEHDYNWDEATLSTEGLLNAVGDHIIRGDVGTSEEYAAGEHFVYPLTQELAEMLWSHESDLEQHQAVQALLDYGVLKQKYS